MSKKLIIIIGLSAVTAYVVFAIATFSSKPDKQICNNLEIVVSDSARLHFVTPTGIRKLLTGQKLNPVGMNMHDIPADKIEKFLKDQSRLKHVVCYKTPSGGFHIKITQREPILRVIMNNGKSYYVDSDGVIMPDSENFTAYVPVATGAISEEMAKGDLYDFALFLRRDPFWNAQIEQIYVGHNENVEIIPRVGNQVIVLGKLDNYEYKLKKLFALYKNGFSRTGWNCYHKIDLRFENQVFCSRK
jgi:cell division protein FtsQ